MGFCPFSSFRSDLPSMPWPMSLWSCCWESATLLSSLPSEWALGATGQAGGWDRAPVAQTALPSPAWGWWEGAAFATPAYAWRELTVKPQCFSSFPL